jgi:DNA-binding NarL/FixJ family response regulator
MAGPAKLLLVDGYALFRRGLQSAIDRQTDMEVVGEANNGMEALAKTRELNPDLIIMGISTPYCNNAQTIRFMKQERPDVDIVLLTTTYDGDEIVVEAVKSGARGFIPRDSDAPHLLRSLRKVLKGEVVIPDRVLGKILDEFTRLTKNIPHIHIAGIPTPSLTPREEEVLQYIAEGASNKEIATCLCVTARTVKSHASNIFAKLGAHNRYEAADIARKIGLLRSPLRSGGDAFGDFKGRPSSR